MKRRLEGIAGATSADKEGLSHLKKITIKAGEMALNVRSRTIHIHFWDLFLLSASAATTSRPVHNRALYLTVDNTLSATHDS